MPTYYVNEAAFALPERGFVDRTLHRLESPLPGAEDPLNIEIRRVPMEKGKSLRQLVDAELTAAKEKVNGFTVVKEGEMTMDGAPAIVLRARLRAREEVYYQLQAHVAVGETWISIHVTGPSAQRVACEEAFGHIVESLEWRS
ncbi:MAG: DcrB-related protein [Polyangiaceae bacterium]|nr:DcrB-related protein [Polyangiaceae bacterium]